MPRQTPTKATTTLAIRRTRCGLVAEIICVYRPTTMLATPSTVAARCWRTIRPVTNATMPASRVKAVSPSWTGCRFPSVLSVRPDWRAPVLRAPVLRAPVLRAPVLRAPVLIVSGMGCHPLGGRSLSVNRVSSRRAAEGILRPAAGLRGFGGSGGGGGGKKDCPGFFGWGAGAGGGGG